MSKNIYDTFRGIQEKRKQCYDERSAAFIEHGKMSKDIIHKRLDKDIKAAVVFSDKEGPDEVIVFSFIEDDLQKSDYFIYKDTNFLVYEDIRLTDDDINYKKQRAVECNVMFTFEKDNYIGYYKSALRGSEDPDFVGKEIVIPKETPLLILPTNNKITINSEFVIEEKPFKVSEYDNITNKGITYYYLERSYNKNIPTVETTEENKTIDGLMGTNVIGATDAVLEPKILRAMTEYIFETENAYFAASPKIEVSARTRNQITFRVPFGISQVLIDIKRDGEVVSESYKVVI